MPHETSLNYENTQLPGSRFKDVDLGSSVFDNVSLRQAAFENVALTEATFRNVCFGNVSIEDANIEGMKINGVLVSELFRIYAEGRFMTKNRVAELRVRSIDPTSVLVDGRYTKPRTWGVYRVDHSKRGRVQYTFHLGNHPVRLEELRREYGTADLLSLFLSKCDAEELRHLLNSERTGAI